MEIVSVKDVGIEMAAAKAASVLRSGGLVVYPTDTLYGFGATMDNPEAIAKLHKIKSRDECKFLSFVVPDVLVIETYAYMNDTARTLATRFLPGPLTLKLKAKDTVPATIAHDGAIRFRIPDDGFALALAREVRTPFSATSANISGEVTLPTVEEIVAQFGDWAAGIDLIVDDGPRAGRIASTIISCLDDTVEIIREGALSREMFGL